MIRALREAWYAFWSGLFAGLHRQLVGPEKHQTDMRQAMAEAEAEILAKLPEARREEARERLHEAMRRYGFTERDRRHQAGRES